MKDTQIEITAQRSLDTIDPAAWDACACPEAAAGGRPRDPFTTYRFLKALEHSRSVGRGTGWEPRYLAVSNGTGAALALMDVTFLIGGGVKGVISK